MFHSNSFIVEGVFTIIVAAHFVLLLPGNLDTPKPLFGPGIIRFSERDRLALRARLDQNDDLGKPRNQETKVDWKLVRKTLSNWRRWPHCVSTFVVFSTWSPLTTYTPSIIVLVHPPEQLILKSILLQRAHLGRFFSCKCATDTMNTARSGSTELRPTPSPP